MTLSTKMMIGVFSMWVMLQIICNWFDGQTNMLTAADMSTVGQLGQYSEQVSTEEAGEASTIKQWTSNARASIDKILFFKYSFWFVATAGYTEATCEAAGYEWDSTNSICLLPGPWQPFWFVVLRPIGWAIILAIVAIGVGKLFG